MKIVVFLGIVFLYLPMPAQPNQRSYRQRSNKIVTARQIKNKHLAPQFFKLTKASTAALPPNSVTTPIIANAAVTNQKIASNTVSSDKLTNGSITQAKIANNAITASHLSNALAKQLIAQSSNIPNSLVGRDNLGNFSASTIYANTFKGNLTGSILPDAQNNLCIGNESRRTDTLSNSIVLGDPSQQKSCFISGIYGATCSASSASVFINPDGKLSTLMSSKEYKKNITPLDCQTEILQQLTPVAFEYIDENCPGIQYGLIAEDVEKINETMVIFDANNKPISIHYHFLPIMLLKEYQNLAQTIEIQTERISTLEAILAALLTSTNESANQRT